MKRATSYIIKQLWVLLFVLIFSGCSREIEFDQPSYQSKVVVDGYIEANGYAYIFLTASSPFLTEYDSASIRNTFLNHGVIKLTSSLGESETLTLFRQNNFFPPFVYRSVGIKGAVGVTYDLTISVGGRQLSASTTIPQPPVIDTMYMDAQTDTTGMLKVGLHFDTNSDGYLLMQLMSLRSDNNFHAAYNPVLSISKDNKNAIVNVLRSRESNLYYINRGNDPYIEYPKFQYNLNDTIWLKIGSLDEQSFQVMKSIFIDQASRENPFAFNNEIQTNIAGGIGRWTGIGAVKTFAYYGKKTP